MICAFDLDGTLCSEERTFDKALAQPLQANIDIANKLYDQGHRIIIYTARHWAEYRVTEHWLKTHNVKHHQIICGKLLYDVLVDDKALNVKDIGQLKTEGN